MESEMGPVITSEVKKRICGLILLGIDEDAKLILDGRGNSAEGFQKGNFIGPYILTNVTPSMKCFQ